MKAYPGLFCLIAVLAVAGCGKHQPPPAPAPAPASNPPPAASERTTAASNVVVAPLEYVAAVGRAQESAMKKIDISYIQTAIQQFQAAEGRYPKDLDELVKEHYLNKLPPVPYGYQLKYDATEGKVSVIKQQ